MTDSAPDPDDFESRLRANEEYWNRRIADAEENHAKVLENTNVRLKALHAEVQPMIRSADVNLQVLKCLDPQFAADLGDIVGDMKEASDAMKPLPDGNPDP